MNTQSWLLGVVKPICTLNETNVDWNVKFTNDLHNRNDALINSFKYDPTTKILSAMITN
jgi:hypothetical protein